MWMHYSSIFQEFQFLKLCNFIFVDGIPMTGSWIFYWKIWTVGSRINKNKFLRNTPFTNIVIYWKHCIIIILLLLKRVHLFCSTGISEVAGLFVSQAGNGVPVLDYKYTAQQQLWCTEVVLRLNTQLSKTTTTTTTTTVVIQPSVWDW